MKKKAKGAYREKQELQRGRGPAWIPRVTAYPRQLPALTHSSDKLLAAVTALVFFVSLTLLLTQTACRHAHANTKRLHRLAPLIPSSARLRQAGTPASAQGTVRPWH